jgi:hypothetical protein
MTETDLSSKSIEWLSCEFARRYNNIRGDLDELVGELRRRDEAVKAICSAAASCLREFGTVRLDLRTPPNLDRPSTLGHERQCPLRGPPLRVRNRLRMYLNGELSDDATRLEYNGDDSWCP